MIQGIGVERCYRLGGQEKFLTAPTFRPNHTHFGINEVLVTGGQGVLGCKRSSKSRKAYFEAILFMKFYMMIHSQVYVYVDLCVDWLYLESLAISQSDDLGAGKAPLVPRFYTYARVSVNKTNFSTSW